MMAFLGDETVTCANCGCLTHLHGSADAKLTTDRAHREGERAMSDLGKSLTSFKKR